MTMLDIGSRIEQHDGSKESAQLIIANLLYKPSNRLKHPPGWIDHRLWRRYSFQEAIPLKENWAAGERTKAPITLNHLESIAKTSENPSWGSRCMVTLTWLIRRITSDTSPPSGTLWTVMCAVSALLMAFWLNLSAFVLACRFLFHEVIITPPFSLTSIIPLAMYWDWALVYSSSETAYLAIFLYDLWLFNSWRDRNSTVVVGFPSVITGVLSIWAMSSLASSLRLFPLVVYIRE
jgi:hypothetical protein